MLQGLHALLTTGPDKAACGVSHMIRTIPTSPIPSCAPHLRAHARRPTPRILRAARTPRAFTLVELVVVMLIIALLVALAVPAMETITRQSQFTEVTSQISALLAATQAETRNAPAALVIMRARQRTAEGQLLGPLLQPPHQVAYVTVSLQHPDDIDPSGQRPPNFAGVPGSPPDVTTGPYFRPVPTVRPLDLPSEFWVAPAEGPEPGDETIWFDDDRLNADQPFQTNLGRVTRDADSPLDYLWILFDQGGELIRVVPEQDPINQPAPSRRLEFIAAINRNAPGGFRQADEPRRPAIAPTALGLVTYDRQRLLLLNSPEQRRQFVYGDPDAGITAQSRPIYVSRYGAAAIPGSTERLTD